MEAVAESFRSGGGAWRPMARTGFPRGEIDDATEALVESGLLVRTETPADGVLPARPPEEVTAREVASATRFAERRGHSILPPDLAALCEEADRAAGEVLARHVFGATPPPPSATPDTQR